MGQDWRALAAAPLAEQAAALGGFIAGHPHLAPILLRIRDWGLPDAWLTSGAIYQNLWNEITGRPPGHGVKDHDILYFDASDLSWAAEDRVIRQAAAAGRELGLELELRNQARVHLWFERRFGFAVPPLRRTLEALERYASTTHAVAARLTDGGEVEIAAPYGLRDIFAMHLRPNRLLPNGPSHDAKAARCLQHWPELTVEWAGEGGAQALSSLGESITT